MYNWQIVVTERIILHVMAKIDEKMFRSCEECDNFTENQIKYLLGKIVDNIVLTLLHTWQKTCNLLDRMTNSSKLMVQKFELFVLKKKFKNWGKA